MDGPPAGFSRRSLDGAEAVLRDDVADALLAAGLADPEATRPSAVSEYAGRGRPFGLRVDGVGRVCVRSYRHGGLFRKLSADRYPGEGRFLGELAAHVEAAAAGVPVAEALGIVSRSAGMGTRRGWLLTRELPDAVDLLAFLDASPAARDRGAALAAGGRAMRRLHDAGFDHPDLHMKNVLVEGPDAVRVLDLDRTRRRPSMSRERRLAALRRFDRFAAKQARAGHPVTRTDRLRVLRAYAGADWPERRELRTLADSFRRHIARHQALRGSVPRETPA